MNQLVTIGGILWIVKTFSVLKCLVALWNLAQHLDLFPKSTLAGKSFAALGAALSKLSEHASEQVTTRNAVSANVTVRAAARESLYRQIVRISSTADALAIDSPELKAKFRVPFTNNDQELLQTARAFLIEVEPLKKDFIQHHMPADFIRRLNAAVDEFEPSMRELGSVKTRRRNGKVSVDQTLADCATLVRRLDAVVANAVIGSPPLEAEWDAARRVRRVQSRSVSRDSSPEPTKDGRSAERKRDSAQPQEQTAPTEENPAA